MKQKLFSITIALAALTVTTEAATTVQNLNRTYQSESNAANRYRQFASKADAENLRQTAKLFRAAAVSEEIHSKIVARAIVKIGGRIDTFKLDAVTPGTTAENLQSAIRDETAESGTDYRGFLTIAKADREKSAVRAFNYSMRSDKELATLFQHALDDIRGETSITCYVCEDCGLVVIKLPEKKCPICREGLKEFKIIN
ncbi:MAG: rubrerythrin family protein [Akkermansiaceae bacterium]|nr:rubrerythrin family protein [Akkermansiaceae bacterium]